MTDSESPDTGEPQGKVRDLSVVAIIGRPNVGKSTLFNRLSGKRIALVDNMPGVTRDRRESDAVLAGAPFRVIDTAGLEDVHDSSLEARMRAQTEQAVRDADVVLFVVDAREGISALDTLVARDLRKQKTPIILVANKAEGRAGISGIGEAYSLGFGAPDCDLRRAWRGYGRAVRRPWRRISTFRAWKAKRTRTTTRKAGQAVSMSP